MLGPPGDSTGADATEPDPLAVVPVVTGDLSVLPASCADDFSHT
jgi:hypothetical protein